MLRKLKWALYKKRTSLLFNEGRKNGLIVPFDDEFYEKMSNFYFNGIPISMHIKYLKPILPPGRCYDRSLYMFFCFENAILVRGDNKDLELEYGKDKAGHGWIEIDNYVYDPSLLMRFDKELYYKIYIPTNLEKYTKEDYQATDIYEDVRTTTIKDFQPGGRKRIDLITSIPIIKGIAEISGNQEFIDELNKHLSLIQYDERKILNEMDNNINLMLKEKSKTKSI